MAIVQVVGCMDTGGGVCAQSGCLSFPSTNPMSSTCTGTPSSCTVQTNCSTMNLGADGRNGRNNKAAVAQEEVSQQPQQKLVRREDDEGIGRCIFFSGRVGMKQKHILCRLHTSRDRDILCRLHTSRDRVRFAFQRFMEGTPEYEWLSIYKLTHIIVLPKCSLEERYDDEVVCY